MTMQSRNFFVSESGVTRSRLKTNAALTDLLVDGCVGFFAGEALAEQASGPGEVQRADCHLVQDLLVGARFQSILQKNGNRIKFLP